MSKDNNVIAAWLHGGKRQFLRLNREARTWSAISIDDDEPLPWYVAGFEGSSLVTWGRGTALVFYKPEPQPVE